MLNWSQIAVHPHMWRVRLDRGRPCPAVAPTPVGSGGAGAELRGPIGDDAMSSLYDDLSEKLKKDPRLTKRGGARYDLGLLLFNARDSLHELWVAADRYTRGGDSEALDDLQDAVEKLRPIFGERHKR